MTRTVLGIVTIGQSPRPDLQEAFRLYAPGARVDVRGALDGLPPPEIERLARVRGCYPLLVRLADGTGCTMDMSTLQPLVELRVRELAVEGVRAVVVACTGAFPAIACPVPLILPGRVLPAVVGSIVTRREIGVVTPLERQVEATQAKWNADGFAPIVSWASPLAHDEIVHAAAVMHASNVELIVLDCMGHDESYAVEFARRTGKRVVTAQSITARVAGEWLR